jgi:hypothetical protein
MDNDLRNMHGLLEKPQKVSEEVSEQGWEDFFYLIETKKKSKEM